MEVASNTEVEWILDRIEFRKAVDVNLIGVGSSGERRTGSGPSENGGLVLEPEFLTLTLN